MQRFEHGGDVYGNKGVALDFSVNINPLGMPDEVRRAIISGVDKFMRYPDPECRELCAAIARQQGVPQEWVLCGNGAADLIYRICTATKPRRALICAPTFSEYERALEQVGCHLKRHILKAESGFEQTEDILSCLTPDIDMLFLCNPNNPTGRLISPGVLEKILKQAYESGIIVVIDECFLDFTYALSAKKHLGNMPGLIILRAFTKMYAVAGLRLGYLLCDNIELTGKISATAQCWSVSVPAQIAGVAATLCDGWEDKTRKLVADERQFLSDSLSSLGLWVLPSDANYLLLRSQIPLYEPLLQRGILIRRCENFAGLDKTYYRVCTKTRADNTRLVRTIKEVVNG